MGCVGKFSAHLKVDKTEIHEDVYVIKGLETPLLSRQAAEKLQLITRVQIVESNEYKDSVMAKYPELFKLDLAKWRMSTQLSSQMMQSHFH